MTFYLFFDVRNKYSPPSTPAMRNTVARGSGDICFVALLNTFFCFFFCFLFAGPEQKQREWQLGQKEVVFWREGLTKRAAS